MNEIIEYIDGRLAICYPDYKLWGLAEIITKSEDRFPLTVGTREKVCIDEAYYCVVWHREVSVNYQDNEEFSFGLKTERQFNVRLRTIVAYKVELGEDFKFQFADNFPQNIELPGYLILNMFASGFNLDHEAIAKEEEIHTRYNQHRICWNIFTFENEFQFILCPDTSPCNNL